MNVYHNTHVLIKTRQLINLEADSEGVVTRSPVGEREIVEYFYEEKVEEINGETKPSDVWGSVVTSLESFKPTPTIIPGIDEFGYASMKRLMQNV